MNLIRKMNKLNNNKLKIKKRKIKRKDEERIGKKNAEVLLK
jgi:hypothetical protein